MNLPSIDFSPLTCDRVVGATVPAPPEGKQGQDHRDLHHVLGLSRGLLPVWET